MVTTNPRTGTTDEGPLERSRVFQGVGRRRLAAISGLGTVLDVDAGRVMCGEGEPVREFVVILRGRCRQTRNGELIGELTRDECFGGVPDGARDVVHDATYTAATPMRVLVYDAREYRDLVAHVPEIGKRS